MSPEEENREDRNKAFDRHIQLVVAAHSSVIDMGVAAIKSAGVINAAALALVFAFISQGGENLRSANNGDTIRSLAAFSRVFGYGLFSAALAAVFAYVAQYNYGMQLQRITKLDDKPYMERNAVSDRHGRIGWSAHVVCAFLVLLSICQFFYALYGVGGTLSSHYQTKISSTIKPS